MEVNTSKGEGGYLEIAEQEVEAKEVCRSHGIREIVVALDYS